MSILFKIADQCLDCREY